MLKEFKEFAMKGNVVDMAVGIVRGIYQQRHQFCYRGICLVFGHPGSK